MANFEVKTHKIKIEPHPNADALELAVIGDYRSIVRKDTFRNGDVVAYIPEDSILPDELIEEMGLTGRLAGPQHNRVKAIRLRGVISQGLVYPVDSDLGIDVTKELGITKYEPPVPLSMSGEVIESHGKTLSYDIENIKKYPDTFPKGEPVTMTEKIHGTWCCIGLYEDVVIITSKGLSARGLSFQYTDENLRKNVYMRVWESIYESFEEYGMDFYDEVNKVLEFGNTWYIIGEVYGPGIQDLHYDAKEPTFRMFDIYVGKPNEGKFLSTDELEQVAKRIGIPTVPVVYSGPYSEDVLKEVTSGKSTIGNHLREGVVIRPKKEREDIEIGRVILKSVSDDYLLRKGGTEYV